MSESKSLKKSTSEIKHVTREDWLKFVRKLPFPLPSNVTIGWETDAKGNPTNHWISLSVSQETK